MFVGGQYSLIVRPSRALHGGVLNAGSNAGESQGKKKCSRGGGKRTHAIV
jgi:hypothetical protein